jgi:hypothetical protein
VHATLDDLVLALYVTIDDLLRAHPEQLPPRPTVGFVPKVTDVELITLAVMAALGGYTSERRWLRHARQHLSGMFPYLPAQPGYNKRLRKLAPTMRWLIAMIGADCSIADDDVWVVDSTPVECARSRETVLGSGRVGRVRLLRLTFAVLLGAAAASGVHPAWAAGRVGAHRREGRRTRGSRRHPGRLPIVPAGAGRQMLIADKN